MNSFTAEIPMSQPGHQTPAQPEMTMKVNRIFFHSYTYLILFLFLNQMSEALI